MPSHSYIHEFYECRKEICFADLDLSGEEWKGASPEATDFVRSILVKDPEKVV